jgi:uncharacterized membrane protein
VEQIFKIQTTKMEETMTYVNKHCTEYALILIAGIYISIASLTTWAARPETYTKLDVPTGPVTHAAVTVASGVNSDGYIVGWYCLAACNPSRFKGFLRDPDGNYHDIIVPSDPSHPAIGTQPRYISPQGIVVGNYLTLEDGATLNNPRFRGFTCPASNCSGPDAQFTFFDAPDQSVYDNTGTADSPIPHSIIPRAINANGNIVGCIHDKDQMDSMHGFSLVQGTFTTLTDGMTMNNGINNEGEIVGLDNNFTGYHIDKFGRIERLNLPGAEPTDFVNPWDINSKGEIVGQAFVSGVGHAFLRNKAGEYKLIDPAGASTALAFAISSNGNIVGQYRDASGVHGFLLQRGDD